MEITCTICLEVMRYPVHLSCGHNVCKGCILTSASVSSSRHGSEPGIHILCPACRTQASWPSEGDIRIHTGLADRVAELYQETSTSVPCHRCEAVEATVQCSDCGGSVVYCSGCSDLVHVGKMRSHRIQYSSEAVAKAHRTPMCPRHPGYRQEVLCDDCSEWVCVVCTQSELVHRGHRLLSQPEAAESEKKRLRRLQETATVRLRVFRDLVKSLDHAVEDIMLTTEEEITMMDRAMQALLDRIEEKRVYLKNAAKDTSTKHLLKAQAERDKLMQLAGMTNECLANVSSSLKDGHPLICHNTRLGVEARLPQTPSPNDLSHYEVPQMAFHSLQALLHGVESLAVQFCSKQPTAIGANNQNTNPTTSTLMQHAVPPPSSGTATTTKTPVVSPQRSYLRFDKSTYGEIKILHGGLTAASYTNSWETVMSCTMLSVGVHYWEVVLDRYHHVDPHNIIIGVVFDGAHSLCEMIGEDGTGVGISVGRGTKCINNTYTLEYTHPFRSGDVVGVILDYDHRTLSYTRNGVPLGIAFHGIVSPAYPAVSMIHHQEVSFSIGHKHAPKTLN
eukprot:PhF_6_TR40357/c0_g1_i1/m.60051